jgi:hypothetical protein
LANAIPAVVVGNRVEGGTLVGLFGFRFTSTYLLQEKTIGAIANMLINLFFIVKLN